MSTGVRRSTRLAEKRERIVNQSPKRVSSRSPIRKNPKIQMNISLDSYQITQKSPLPTRKSPPKTSTHPKTQTNKSRTNKKTPRATRKTPRNRKRFSPQISKVSPQNKNSPPKIQNVLAENQNISIEHTTPKRESPRVPHSPQRESPRTQQTSPRAEQRKPPQISQAKKSINIPAKIMGNVIYDTKQVLGEGGFGKVWMAENSVSKEPVAIKVFETNKNTDYLRETAFGELIKQISANEVKCNPFVVCIFDTGRFFTENNIPANFIVYELMDGDLDTYPFPSIREILQALYDSSRGLLWIHNKQLAHSDIKPSNILYKQNELVQGLKGEEQRTVFKMGDLGGSCSVIPSEKEFRFFKGTYSFPCQNGGTPFYSAPEVLSSMYPSHTNKHPPHPYFFHTFTEDSTSPDQEIYQDTRTRPSYKTIQRADIFSLGVTFYVITKKYLTKETKPILNFPYIFRKNSNVLYIQDVINSVKNGTPLNPLVQEEILTLDLGGNGENKEGVDKNKSVEEKTLLADLINGMLQVNPNHRLLLPQVIRSLQKYFYA